MKKLMAFSILALMLAANAVKAENPKPVPQQHASDKNVEVKPPVVKPEVSVQPRSNIVPPQGGQFQASPNPCGDYQGFEGFMQSGNPSRF
jgi:hypothetical protein